MAGKLFKVGATVLSVATGAVGAVELAENVIEHQQVVEQYNYENIHEINITDTYIVNGVEVSYEEFVETKNKQDSIITRVETNTVQVIEEGNFTLYYGSVTEIPSSLEGLTRVDFENTPNTFTQTIVSGEGEGRSAVGQYPTIAVPTEYEISSITTSGFSLSFDKVEIEGYDLFFLDVPTDDRDLGGITYTFTLTK